MRLFRMRISKVRQTLEPVCKQYGLGYGLIVATRRRAPAGRLGLRRVVYRRGDAPLRRGSCSIKHSLSLGIGWGHSGSRSGAAAGGSGLRASGGDGAFCVGAWPSMPASPANSAKRKARATSDTLSERLVAACDATRSRPEWNDGDLGIPSGETTRRGFASVAVNIAREGARAAGPAWTIAGGGRQRHPSWARRRLRDRCELRGRLNCHALCEGLAPRHVRAHRAHPPLRAALYNLR